jgi:hypothetical protein
MSSRAGYVVAVGVIAGFTGVVFVSAWSQMVPGFSGNRLITDGWVVCSLLLCLLLGNLYFGSRALAVTSPLRFLAYMQIGTGISSLVAVQLLPAVGAVAGAMGGAGSVVAGLLAFGVFFVPCFLLGGIIAFCASLAAPGNGDRHTAVSRLTTPVFVGATAGVLLSTFALVPALGYWRTLLVGAIVIAVTGLTGLILKDRVRSETSQRTGSADPKTDKSLVRVAGVASTIFIAGTLVCVILWARLLAQACCPQIGQGPDSIDLGGGWKRHLLACHKSCTEPDPLPLPTCIRFGVAHMG